MIHCTYFIHILIVASSFLYSTDILIGNKITLDRIFLKLAYSADKNTFYKMLNMCFYRYNIVGS